VPRIRRPHHLVARLCWLLTGVAPEPIELLASLAALFFGLRLLDPQTSTFASSGSFIAMAAIAPESHWGLFMVALALFHLGALLAEVRWRHHTIFALGALFTFLSVMFARSNPASTATVIYPVWAVSAYWASALLRVGPPRQDKGCEQLQQ
jgi:hypothetical protein